MFMQVRGGLKVYPSNERGLVNLIVKRINNRFPDAWLLKTQSTGYQRTGVPDLLFSIGGKLGALEVKHRKPGESEARILSRVTPSQWDEIFRLVASGAVAGVVWDLEQVDKFLDTFETQ